MAAKSWVSLSATTSNTTSQSAAFQILEWNFNEAQKCRIALVKCYKGIDITNSKILSTLNLKNIGKEILYIKVIYDSTDSVEYSLDQETWQECRDSNGDIIPAFIDYSFYNGFLDGCSLQLNIDDTIQDVVIHNHLNESYSSLNTYFEIIDNPEILNSTQEICMRTKNEVVEIGFCGCGKCIDIFDDLDLYNLGKQTYCQNKYLSNSRCFCFEASHTNATNENLVFQNHTICNECAFDSQCSWFLPNTVCIPSSNNYKIGNPLEPTVLSYGFQNYTLDQGRVTDGVIKGPICDCESARTVYDNINIYKTYPDYQIPDLTQKGNCIKCLSNSTKLESDCASYCGGGVNVHVFTQPSGWGCQQCMLSGEQFQEMNSTNQNLVINCIQTSKLKNDELALYACLKNLETVDESTAIIGLITHFLAECPSKPLTIAGDPANNGAVCMPYYDASGNNSYAFSLKKGIFDTNIFPEQYQCIDSTCNSSTKANCASGTCVCYDTCPLGKTYFPVVGMSWENPADVATMQGMGFYYSNPVSLPCSGRGVCKSDGTCVCRSGFLSPNCEIHCSEAGTC